MGNFSLHATEPIKFYSINMFHTYHFSSGQLGYGKALDLINYLHTYVFSSGQLGYGKALDLINYLHEETDYLPWYTALTALTANLRTAMTRDKKSKQLYEVKSFI